MSAFGQVLVFLNNIGMYDVILPFLLVFTLVYAMLEKTKILGVEKVGDEQISRKNLNAMVAFVSGFFVIASTQLVAIINEFTANVVLLLLLITMFLLLMGAFHEETEKSFFLTGWTKTAFIIISFIGILLVFFNSLGWLNIAWDFIILNWDSGLTGIIMFFVVFVALIAFVTHTPKPATAKKEE